MHGLNGDAGRHFKARAGIPDGGKVAAAAVKAVIARRSIRRHSDMEPAARHANHVRDMAAFAHRRSNKPLALNELAHGVPLLTHLRPQGIMARSQPVILSSRASG